MTRNPLLDLLHTIPKESSVLDVGCFGFGMVSLGAKFGRPDLSHSGVDYVVPAEIPVGFDFRHADLNKSPIPFEDDRFDLVVCNHVIEHLRDGVDFFGECARVCKPGGKISVEAPSERSLTLPGFPFARDSFFSMSYFDDPTHAQRVWTPQSFHRLTRYWTCEPIDTNYRISWKRRLAAPILVPWALLTRNGRMLEQTVWFALGWASYLVARKPADTHGKPTFTYYIPHNH